MASRRKVPRPDAGIEREMRNQEVRRANKELAAYFRGARTEREARAALKIIKAYVRAREREDPASRSPLPGLQAAKRPARQKPPRKRKARPVRRRPSPAEPETSPPSGDVHGE